MATRGINRVVSDIRRFGENAIQAINSETEAVANQISSNAKTLAPKNFGKLAQSISVEKKSDDLYIVKVNEKYGAFMEFGTGSKVQVPAEFKDIANSLKGQRSGQTFDQGLESIKIWCRAKGIDEKAAYPIFAKILGAGINPQPFLYPAWTKGRKDYQNNLERVLKSLNKKI